MKLLEKDFWRPCDASKAQIWQNDETNSAKKLPEDTKGPLTRTNRNETWIHEATWMIAGREFFSRARDAQDDRRLLSFACTIYHGTTIFLEAQIRAVLHRLGETASPLVPVLYSSVFFFICFPHRRTLHRWRTGQKRNAHATEGDCSRNASLLFRRGVGSILRPAVCRLD